MSRFIYVVMLFSTFLFLSSCGQDGATGGAGGTGPAGVSGVQGVAGVGAAGPAGAEGAIGEVGPSGTGEVGPQGPTGGTGLQGPAGGDGTTVSHVYEYEDADGICNTAGALFGESPFGCIISIVLVKYMDGRMLVSIRAMEAALRVTHTYYLNSSILDQETITQAGGSGITNKYKFVVNTNIVTFAASYRSTTATWVATQAFPLTTVF